jgi:hypothetical protein
VGHLRSGCASAAITFSMKGDKMEKVARAPKAERKMEWKRDVCTQLQELATPLDYRKVMPEQAYTLGIIAPGLVPSVNASIFPALLFD